MLRWLPEDVSTFGPEIDRLFYLIYYITAATFILVTVLMIWFLIAYRHKEGRRATYSHGNTTLEIIWTIIPAAILIVLGSSTDRGVVATNVIGHGSIEQKAGKRHATHHVL